MIEKTTKYGFLNRRYIFSIFLGSALFIGIGLKLKDLKMKDIETGTYKKRVGAVLTGELSLPLTPENISTIPLFQIHTNLWGTLLSKDTGQGISNIVSVSDDEKEITFQLKSGAKFSNGKKITSADVEFSLQRLMGRQASGHFNAKTIIESVHAISDESFLLKLRFPSKALQYLLTVSETGIVPKENVDKNGNLLDLSVTSGPYFVSGEPSKNYILLKKNPYYLHQSDSAPEEVEVHFKRGIEAMLESAQDSNIDFIEIYETAVLDSVKDLKNIEGLSVLHTKPSLSKMLVLDANRVSQKERIAVNKLLTQKLTYTARQGVEKISYEMLPPSSFGSLGLSSSYFDVQNESFLQDLPKDFSLRVDGKMSDLANAILKTLKDAGIKVTLLRQGDVGDHDAALLGQGMNSECPELEFYLAMLSQWAYIKTSDEEKRLVELALHTGDNQKRAEIIKEIGEAVLNDGRIFPLVVTSYVHVYRNQSIEAPDTANYDGDVHFSSMRVKRQ